MTHRWRSTTVQWNKMKHAVKEMRKNPTKAESLLWNKLKDKKLDGVKFRRQHPIGRYAVDFYSNEKNLIIEVDGEIHIYQTEGDKLREQFLIESEFKIVRFSNEEVLNSMEIVLEKIRFNL